MTERTDMHRAIRLIRRAWYSPVLLLIMIWVLGAPRKLGGRKSG
jgi:hypothetical protein